MPWTPEELSALAEAVRDNDQDAIRSFQSRLEAQSDAVASRELVDAFHVGSALVRMWVLGYADEHQLAAARDLERLALHDPNVDVRSVAIESTSDGDPDEARLLLRPIVHDELADGNAVQVLWVIARHGLGTPQELREYAWTLPVEHVCHQLALVVADYLDGGVHRLESLLTQPRYCFWAAFLLARIGTPAALAVAASVADAGDACQDHLDQAVAHLQTLITNAAEGWNDGFPRRRAPTDADERERQRRVAEFIDRRGGITKRRV